MKQCMVCGYVDMTDTCQICPQCSNPFSTGKKGKKQKTPRQSRSSGGGGSSGGSGASLKQIGLIGGIAAGVVGAVIAIYFVVTSLFGTNVLGTAAENSIASLVSHMGSQNNLFTYMEQMNPFDAESNHHVLLGVKTPEVFVSLDTDYAGSKKLMTGTLEFKQLQENMDLSLDFHADKKAVRIYAPDLVTDVYGFTYADLEKKYDKMWLRSFLQLPDAESLNLAPFQSFDLKEYLKEQCGSSWDEFEKTLVAEEYDTRQITLGSHTEECTIYRVQWDQKKAERMMKTLFRKTLGILPDFIPELASNIAPDVRLYVNADNNLVGVDFSFLTSIYTFLLEGENNPWEQVSLKIVSAGGQTMVYTGGVISDANGVRVELKSQNQTVYAIYYNNSDETYSVVSPKGVLCSGTFRADASGFYLESNLQNFSYIFAVSELEQLPEKASEKYVDLIDPSLSEKTRLITELCNSLGITADDFTKILGSFFGG